MPRSLGVALSIWACGDWLLVNKNSNKVTDMKLNVLISCMHEKDTSIIARSNVQTDVIVVNQCDKNSVEDFNFTNKKGKICHAKFICTTERGLSKSRNMAIDYAWGDICQICDDDETFPDNYEDIIIDAYNQNLGASVITFALNRLDVEKPYPVEKRSLGVKEILRTSSQQITFLRNLLGKTSIRFDEKMGSGTGNGGGEENRFLLDCRKARLKMLYVPYVIATVNKGKSQWFKGYTEKYFRDRGWASRRCLGLFMGYAFVLYNIINHRKAFTENGFSFGKVLLNMNKGFFEKR